MQLLDVERALRRPGEYFFEDGLWEIAMGLWLALTVGVPLLVGGWLGNWAPVIMLLAVPVVRPAVVAAKERWVFPRTGHVTYPSLEQPPQPVALHLSTAQPPALSDRANRALRVLTPTFVGTTIAILIPLLTRGARGAPAGQVDRGALVGHLGVGLLLGGALLYAAWRYRQRRWAAVGLALIASGPLVGALSDSREQALAWHVSLMAGALVASGASAFASYLRRTAGLPDANAR